VKRSVTSLILALALVSIVSAEQKNSSSKKPKVIVFGVNGAELDIIRPLLVRGEMPNMARLIDNGVSGKLKTVPAPNCPKAYTAIQTSTVPEKNGITGFVIGGQTATTHMIKEEPLWSILSKNGVEVGMANVPATFPVQPVNGYVISGMLTRGNKESGCEDGVLCAPKLSQVVGGDAIYPPALKQEIMSKVGDIYIDCSRMPSKRDIEGKEVKVINEWLGKVDEIRAQQTRLFDYLLTHHPTDFTFLVQSCEDRVGHWLYPIAPFHVGYDEKVAKVRVDAFPDQYRAMDKVLGEVLKHVDNDTYVFIVSDHGIKPLRYAEAHDAHKDHAGTTPVIAKHDYADGDEVPGTFVAMGPGIKKGVTINGLQLSVYDIAPTILKIYGIKVPPQMQGRVLSEIFASEPATVASAAK
jgi:predicted AlkP superfamily phosphohydrolase/phosphomutase